MIDTKAKRSGIKNGISLLAGIAKCGKCGAGLTFKKGGKKNKSNYYCQDYIKYGKRLCTSHHLGSDEFEDLVITRLQNAINEKLNFKETTSNVKSGKVANQNSIKNNIKKLEKELILIDKKTDAILGKNLEGIISDTQFASLNKQYSEQADAIREKLDKIKSELLENVEKESNNDFIKRVFEEVKDIRDMPTERQRYLILDLIENLTMNDGEVKITYKF